MEITEVRVVLINQPSRFKAVCDIVLDHVFVVHGIRVIKDHNGLVVVMPSRKITDHCPLCRSNNPLTSKFCDACGAKLPARQYPMDIRGRSKLFADVVHPANIQCRDMIREKVLQAYEIELNKSGRIDSKPAEIDDQRPENDDEPKGA